MTPPRWSAPRSRALGVIITTGVWLLQVAGRRGNGHRQRHRLRGPGGGGFATPPRWSAPRLCASGVIITGVWLLLRQTYQEQPSIARDGQSIDGRYASNIEGATLHCQGWPKYRRQASSSRASRCREWRGLVVMDNDDGIICGAGGRRSRDPSLLLSPACSRVSRHQHGRRAAASGGASSSWTTTIASSSGPGGGGLATPPSWSAHARVRWASSS